MPAQQPQELRKTEIEREARKVLQDARVSLFDGYISCVHSFTNLVANWLYGYGREAGGGQKKWPRRRRAHHQYLRNKNERRSGVSLRRHHLRLHDEGKEGGAHEKSFQWVRFLCNIFHIDTYVLSYTKIDRRVKCRDVMTAFKKLYADFLLLEQSNCLYYDLQAIMYSLKPLNVDAVRDLIVWGKGSLIVFFQESGNLFGIPLNFVPSNDGFVRFEVLIKCISENRASTLRLGNLSHVTRDVGDIDQSLEQFLNLATSQDIMFNKLGFFLLYLKAKRITHFPTELLIGWTLIFNLQAFVGSNLQLFLYFSEDHVTFSTSSSFLLDPIKYGFQPNDLPLFPDNGTYLAVGAQKGVRFIEGPSSGGFASLVVEVKKTAFHNVELVLQKAVRFVADAKNLYTNALTNVERERLNRQLKGGGLVEIIQFTQE